MPKNYTVTLPHYSVGPSCYDELGQVTRFYGRTAAVVGGETALAKAGPALKAGFEKAGVKLTEWTVYGKDSTNANVEKIVNNPKVQEADLLFGVGGGREDCCRYSRQALLLCADRFVQLCSRFSYCSDL